MNAAEKKERRRQWGRLIERWKKMRLDRSCWKVTTLEEDKEDLFCMIDKSYAERMEYFMRLRWMNYGPDALYGRLERVYSIGQLPPAKKTRGRRKKQGHRRKK